MRPRFCVLAATLAALLVTPAAAQTDTQEGGLGIELNKLEDVEGTVCRAYFILRNDTDAVVDDLQLDSYIFDPDGIISQRLTLPFGRAPTARIRIVTLDLALPCGSIGSLFVNELVACETAGTLACESALTTTSRAEQPFTY
ncbi:MAG: Tat pathway signal protein [Pseudomonadota bacterium]